MTGAIAAALEEARAQIGREWPTIVHEVTPAGCRQFARAVGYTDLVFYDAAVARSRGYPNIPAPFGYLGTPVYTPGEVAPAIAYRIGLPYKRALNGGTELEYATDVFAGDELLAKPRIAEITERTSSSGLMIGVVTETDFFREAQFVARLKGTSLLFP